MQVGVAGTSPPWEREPASAMDARGDAPAAALEWGSWALGRGRKLGGTAPSLHPSALLMLTPGLAVLTRGSVSLLPSSFFLRQCSWLWRSTRSMGKTCFCR